MDEAGERLRKQMVEPARGGEQPLDPRVDVAPARLGLGLTFRGDPGQVDLVAVVEPHAGIRHDAILGERRIRTRNYYVRRPQAAPYREDRFWSFRQAGVDALGVLLVLAFLTFVLWMPAVFR